MVTTIIRTVILYLLLIIVMRVMGKRQIGQLQPGELVITIMISEIATIPMQDNDIPMLHSIISVLLLASLEVIFSALSMKSIRLRSVFQGNPLIIIRNGVLDQKQLKRLRFTVDDLQEALRQKDVFNIEDVQFAVVETDGSLSVLLKPDKRAATVKDAKAKPENTGLPCTVISDGKIIRSSFDNCMMNDKKLQGILKKNNAQAKNILLMTYDGQGNTHIVKKEKSS